MTALNENKYRILFVDDEPYLLDGIKRMLHEKKHEWILDFTTSAFEAEELIKEKSYDVVVLDVRMPQKSGFDILTDLKIHEKRENFEVIMLTGLEERELKRKALALGANDLLTKPVVQEDLVARLESAIRTKTYRDEMLQRTSDLEKKNVRLEEEIQLRAATEKALRNANAKLEKLAVTDQLTGLYNRRLIFEKLKEYIRLSKRLQQPLSCMLADIDHFKNVNDTYGHQAGDRVLKDVAGILLGSVRKTDILARYGGEEFIFLLPDTTEEDTFLLAEKLRRNVESNTTSYNKNLINVSISIGIAITDRTGYDEKNLVKETDKAMYEAKRLGRNRVCCSSELL
ncbi:diguanylate cyclase [Calditrichota bacterium]